MSNELTSEQAAFIVKECAKVFDGDKRTAEAFRMAHAALRAQGEPVAYRMLREGEIIDRDDQLLEDDAQTWTPMAEAGRLFVGVKYACSFFVAMRRQIIAPHPKGEEHGG